MSSPGSFTRCTSRLAELPFTSSLLFTSSKRPAMRMAGGNLFDQPQRIGFAFEPPPPANDVQQRCLVVLAGKQVDCFEQGGLAGIVDTGDEIDALQAVKGKAVEPPVTLDAGIGELRLP